MLIAFVRYTLAIPQMLTRPPESAPSEAPNRRLGSLIGDTKAPLSASTSPVLASRFSRGMRYCRNITNPLSTPCRPAFAPRSPTVTPGYALSVAGSRTGTTNAFNPWCCPSAVYSWAYTIRWVQVLPRLPIQHLAASKSGVCSTNSPAAGSYVAVVRIPFAFVPCAISVNPNAPRYSPVAFRSIISSNRPTSSVRMTEGNIPKPSEYFTAMLGSYAIHDW
uniref:Putative secreted protein n=1 Tax=Anopheles triannulatus TaxID=58253 RepID=A0A2M4B4Z4_9DIPT